MTTLVLGATGLLGQAFVAEAHSRGDRVRGVARSGAAVQLDIADPAALLNLLETERPSRIINCAALVDVAACDADPGTAYRVNAAPLIGLVQWARATGAKLIHVSTDHFFGGEGPVAHDEQATMTIMNQYAATKLAGERFAALYEDALVLRTSIVGVRGWETPSFAEWVIDAVVHDRAMTLFTDAFTSSIDVGGFTKAALALSDQGTTGLLNLAAAEVYSKEQFVRAVAAEMNVKLTNVVVGSVDVLHPPRPKSLGLDVSRAQEALRWRLPNLRQVVQAVITAYRGA